MKAMSNNFSKDDGPHLHHPDSGEGTAPRVRQRLGRRRKLKVKPLTSSALANDNDNYYPKEEQGLLSSSSPFSRLCRVTQDEQYKTSQSHIAFTPSNFNKLSKPSIYRGRTGDNEIYEF